MATVTGFTAARMLEVENSCIVNGAVDLQGILTFTRRDGGKIQAGNIRGVGVVPGGSPGHALFKKTANDFDTEWRGITTSDVLGTIPAARIPVLYNDVRSTVLKSDEDPTGIRGANFRVMKNGSFAGYDGGAVKWRFTKGVMDVGEVPFARVTGEVPFARVTGDVPFARVSGDVPFTRVTGDVPFTRMEAPVALASSGTNLNNYATAGLWHQPGNAGAAAGSNYPESFAGLLEVFASGTMVYQRYTVYAMNTTSDSRNARIWTRGRYNDNWSPWLKVAKQGHAAGKVTLKVAMANTTVSAYVSFPTGRFNTGAPACTVAVHTGGPNARAVSISDPSTSGVTIYLWANGVITNSVSWIAQELG